MIIHCRRVSMLLVTLEAFVTMLLFSGVACAQTNETNPAPTASDWANIAKLPDWSGIWTPDINDQNRQHRENKTPWTADAAKQIAEMNAAEAAGRPAGIFNNC